MHIKNFSEGEAFRCAGNDFLMLLPRDATGACEAVLQIVRAGGSTPPNSHETFMQIYLIWSGEAEVFIGGEHRHVVAPAAAFVPPKTEHWVVNPSPDRELQYLYISVWPNGIPREESEGGWRKVYAGIIDEYVSRGFPVEGKQANGKEGRPCE
jgi:mannose-6-phosphate isomerase-like protein (cupin superfamily)